MLTRRGGHQALLQANRRRRRSRRTWIGVIAVLFVALAIGWVMAIKSTEREVDVQVSFKERVCSGSRDSTECKYLVYTDEGTFELTDSILYGNFRSSDIYGRLRQDQCYRFTVTGWRLPFFSAYPNIVRTEDVACS